MIKQLLSLPQTSVWALEDLANKLIFITYSRDMLSGIGAITSQIKNNDFRIKEIQDNPNSYEFKVLEVCAERDLLLKHYYWCSHYEQLGYRLLNVRKGLVPHFRVRNGARNRFYVYMPYSHDTELIVGVFQRKPEAREYVRYLEGLPIPMPVYATNELTQEYYTKWEGSSSPEAPMYRDLIKNLESIAKKDTSS